MKILIVTDAYPPMRTSAANLVYDLGQAFLKEGHQVDVIINNSTQRNVVMELDANGVRLISVRGFKTKDRNYFSRVLAEFFNPFIMWHRLKNHKKFMQHQYDGVVWYSPTIFWGPLIKRIKIRFQIKSYLILRDIFPDWARDLGLIKNETVFRALRLVAAFQYVQADKIGVQSPNNLKYLLNRSPFLKGKLEVLWNWVDLNIADSPPSIELRKFFQSGATVCVYAGNMGVAQNIHALLDLAIAFRDQEDVGFVFIGRGSEKSIMMEKIKKLGIKNIQFFDEIPSEEVSKLLQQCGIGMLSLDTRHTTHNIPGKFLSYLKCGLPIFAIVNEGNDLIDLVGKYALGFISTSNSVNQNKVALENLIYDLNNKKNMRLERINIAKELFSSEQAARDILKSFY